MGLDAFEMGEWHPSDIVAYMYAAPFADDLFDLDLGALVDGKEVGAWAIGRGLGIDDTLCDDGLGAQGVALVEWPRIGACSHGNDKGDETGVESRLTKPYYLAERKEEEAY